MTEARSHQRALSFVQRQEQADHFLSFKKQRAFKSVARFAQHYSLRREIGSGAFGSVKLGEHKKSGTPCAVKVIRKSTLTNNKFRQLNKQELAAVEETVHPYITRVFELMEDNRNYYIIMELVSGGSLFDKIAALNRFQEQ